MKAKQSPLKLKDFNVFDSSIIFIPPEEFQDMDLENLPVNIDFDHYEPKKGSQNQLMVELKLKVNSSGNYSGYKVNITAVGLFEIPEAGKLSETTKSNLYGISSVNLMISNVRGFLMTVTSYAPAGTYILPAIDISDLLGKKNKSHNSTH